MPACLCARRPCAYVLELCIDDTGVCSLHGQMLLVWSSCSWDFTFSLFSVCYVIHASRITQWQPLGCVMLVMRRSRRYVTHLQATHERHMQVDQRDVKSGAATSGCNSCESLTPVDCLGSTGHTDACKNTQSNLHLA
jgi:hypothetical protein